MCISGAAVDELLDDRCAARSGRAVPLPDVQAENSVHAASLRAGTRRPVSTSGRLIAVAGPGEPGNETWPGDNWKRGGGAARLTGPSIRSSTRSTGALAIPVRGMPSIGNGDNLYCSMLALDPKTGRIKWHHQFSPNNLRRGYVDGEKESGHPVRALRG
jgi:hypothetical protein